MISGLSCVESSDRDVDGPSAHSHDPSGCHPYSL